MVKLLFCIFLIVFKTHLIFSQSLDSQLELMNRGWENLEAIHNEIEWFLNSKQEKINRRKAFYLEVGSWEKVQQNHLKMKTYLADLEKQIEQFQNTLGEVILCHYGDKGYGQTWKLAFLAETASDFRAMIEGVIFDENSKAAYEEYQAKLTNKDSLLSE